MNGNQAAALAVKLSRAQVVCAYPITPQTSLVENIAEMWATGNFPGEYVSVESEYSALSYLIGAAYAGARTFTATSCQGLAYMHELLHWASGARLPIVMVNVNRTLGAPWSLEPDQRDSLSQRDTGWIQLYCCDVQEIMDTVILAFRLAEEVKIPCMVIYDGFSLSHTYEAVTLLRQEQADLFLNPPPKSALIHPSWPQTVQPVTDYRYMARVVQAGHRAMMQVPGRLDEINRFFAEIFGRNYPLAEETISATAETIFVAAGAVAQTVKSFLPLLDGGEEKNGLLRLRLFKPLPEEEIAGVLNRPPIKKLVVLDRNLSMGIGGVFAQELKAALQGTGFRGQIFELNLAGGIDLTLDMLRKGMKRINAWQDGEEKIIWGVDL